MCDVPSWRVRGDTVLYLTDQDAKFHGIDWQDATGHKAITKLYGHRSGDIDGEGLGEDTPIEVVEALTSGKLAQIVAAGDLSIRDGEWTLRMSVSGNIYLSDGVTLTAPMLETSRGISLYCGAALNAPVLETSSNIYLDDGVTLNAPVLAVSGNISLYERVMLIAPLLETSGNISLRERADLIAPMLKTCGNIYLSAGATLDAPLMNKKGCQDERI